jgi:hypothetical protein
MQERGRSVFLLSPLKPTDHYMYHLLKLRTLLYTHKLHLCISYDSHN